MTVPPESQSTIGGSPPYKARCFAVIDVVAKGTTSRVVPVKHKRPVAAIVPVAEPTIELWGAMRGTVLVAPGIDLTAPTGNVWDADR